MFCWTSNNKYLNCTLFSTSYKGGLFNGDTIFFNTEDRAGNENPSRFEVELWVRYTPFSEVQEAKP